MSSPNDFMGEATTFNQGWYNTEKTNRTGQRDKAKQQLDQVDPYYETLFEDLGANQGKAMNGLQASMARRGLTRSGIRTRAEGNLLGEYGKLNSKLQTEKTTRKNEMTSNFNLADQQLGNLDSEFASKVAQTARELFNKWTENENSRIAATASSTGGGGAAANDSYNSAEELTADLLRSGKYDWGTIAKMVELDFPGSTTSGKAVDQMLRKWYIGNETSASGGFSPIPTAKKPSAFAQGFTAPVRVPFNIGKQIGTGIVNGLNK